MNLINRSSSTWVDINAAGVLPGEYTLILESFDRNSKPPKLSLKTDIVTIFVTVADSDYSNGIAYFDLDLEQTTIISGKFSEWTLPRIETNGSPLKEVRIKAASLIADEISFQPQSKRIRYSGKKLANLTST